MIQKFVALALIFFLPSALAQEYVYPVGDPFARPIPGTTSSNGYQLTGAFRRSGHTGVDLSNGLEGGKVVSVADGYIRDKCETSSSNKSDPRACNGFGNRLIIEHAGGFSSVYGHMKHGSLTSKSVGDHVSLGEKIGEVDCSGDSRSESGSSPCESNHGVGSHLHFEIKTKPVIGCGYLTSKKDCKIGGEVESSNEFDFIYADPLEFIANRLKSQAAKPPYPYVTFVEGNPGVPGDSITILGLDLGNAAQFSLSDVSTLGRSESGFVVSAYGVGRISYMSIVFGFTGTNCSTGILGALTSIPSVNGATGSAVTIDRSNIEYARAAAAAANPIFDCQNARTDNAYVSEIIAGGVSRLDAAAVEKLGTLLPN
ncbi:MAG: M23 family metallopeptidase [Hyphomonas oceanitis]|uniref:M23 family metallopeptidase n=1 Tax=Hyphomonas oceanitis TaxID=81033 RepID=UPI0030021120